MSVVYFIWTIDNIDLMHHMMNGALFITVEQFWKKWNVLYSMEKKLLLASWQYGMDAV